MGSRKRPLEESEDREHDENLRNVPNTETQELYNTMRALEDAIANGIALDHHVQIQSRGGANEHSRHLGLPSPSLAPTSPRSPASTTQSVTGALENVGIHDEETQPSKKRRAVRHGSLDPVKRAKAALMRKLGACRDCKTRKVKCDHFNRNLFEAGYQATKPQQHLLSVVSTPFSFEPAATTPVTPISLSSDHALSGLGGWQNLQTHVPPTTQQEEQAGQEILLDPPAPSQTDIRSIGLQDNFAPPYSVGLSPPFRAAPIVNAFIPRDPSDPIPIGRRTVYGWECKHGGDDELSVLSHCTFRCHSLSQLLLHFDAMHDSYVTNPFQMWKCIQPTQRDPSRVCGYLLSERSAPCDLCQSTGNARETWCYGTITRTPSLVSGSSYHRVPSGDGSTNWTPPNQQNLGTSYGHYDNQMPFPSRQVGGGGQTGSHHSYSAAPKPVNCFRGVGVGSVYQRSCPYGGSGCLKRSSTDLGAKASVFSLLVMMLTMLSLGLLQTLWVEAKTKQSLAAMLEVAREHVSCMSLACVTAGLVGMWLFKHVKFRLGQDPRDSCDQRCLARDLLGVESKFDVEDAGSMRGEEMAEVDGDLRRVLA